MRLEQSARLFWYRSEEAKCVYATSVLRSSRFDEVDRIWEKFGSSGVLTRDEIRAAAGSTGKVLALKFDSTKILPNEIRVTDLGISPPQSLQRLDIDTAAMILEKGVGHAN